MSEKNMEMMKKLLEKKKGQQAEKLKQRPSKSIGSGSKAKRSVKVGGANNKV